MSGVRLMGIETRQQIYSLLKALVLPEVRYDNGLMNILSSVWDVYQRKSTGEDNRYKLLGDEIEKHYVMNDDWVDDKLFVSILKIYDDEGKFINFTEQLTNLIRGSKGFQSYKTELSRLLEEEGIEIYEEQNVYRIGKKGKAPTPPKGALEVFVCASEVTNAVDFGEKNVQWPKVDNCFVLTFNSLWNDYSYKTRYRLYYVKDGLPERVGEVKIMRSGTIDTSEPLPKQFMTLGEEFCSLGVTTDYYHRLKELLGSDAYIVLGQLRDTAFYEGIYKRFEDEPVYKISLLRKLESDKARREGRYYVYGRDMADAYAFSYCFELPYSGDDVEVDFDFKYSGQNYERIIGMIGENGVGKTSLIRQLLHSLVANDNRQFTRLRPLFSSVLIISYSPFDHFHVDFDGKEPFINYEYSGLMKEKEQMFTTQEQVNLLVKNIKEIYHRRNRYALRWEAFVNTIIPKDKIIALISEGDGEYVDVDEKGLLDFCERASSGETMFLYSISAIMARIRSDSLIIMDEPEQHLHPSAVTALMHSLYRILDKYESYAIISTHSPYIIRELVSPNVMIFKRFEGGLSVKRIGIESFGEDVSVLSDVVFGNMSDEKRYERFIEDVVKRNNYDYEASVRELQTGPNELGLNAKLIVRTIIDRHQG